jgi:hypothetical protein
MLIANIIKYLSKLLVNLPQKAQIDKEVTTLFFDFGTQDGNNCVTNTPSETVLNHSIGTTT